MVSTGSKFLGLASVLIVAMFILTGMGSITSQGTVSHRVNEHMNPSINQQLFKPHFTNNDTNLNAIIANDYFYWLTAKEGTNPYNGISRSTHQMIPKYREDQMFSLFLRTNPNDVSLLNELTAMEKKEFQTSNMKAGQKFIHYLQEHPKTNLLTEKTKDSVYVALKDPKGMYPNGFPTWNGEFTMVSVNYLKVTAPWYLGGWTITYGETDTINILFVGSSAQSWYNQEMNTIHNIETWSMVGGFIYGGALTIANFYGLLTSALAKMAGIISFIIASAAISIHFTQSYMGSALNSMYDSTYANPFNGEPKFLWIFYDATYIYPWVTAGVGVMGSSFSWNGYTNTGTVSIMPYIPVLSNNPAWVATAYALTSEAHSLANKIGWNSWGTVS